MSDDKEGGTVATSPVGFASVTVHIDKATETQLLSEGKVRMYLHNPTNPPKEGDVHKLIGQGENLGRIVKSTPVKPAVLKGAYTCEYELIGD